MNIEESGKVKIISSNYFNVYVIILRDGNFSETDGDTGMFDKYERIEFVDTATDTKLVHEQPISDVRDMIKHYLKNDKIGVDIVLHILGQYSTYIIGDGTDISSIRHRDYYTKLSWVIITQKLLDFITDFCGENYITDVVDIGSGNSLLVALLMHPQTQKQMIEKHGFAANFIATEKYYTHGGTETESFYPTEKLSAIEAVEKYPNETPMFVWPGHDMSYAYDVLIRTEALTCIYIGEGYGGATADDKFHDELAESWSEISYSNITSWPGVSDRAYGYLRKL